MRVKLLAKHVIADRELPAETILVLPAGVAPTPLMEGLDEEARTAIAALKFKTFARYERTRRGVRLIDDPPIEYPLDNPPVPVGGNDPYGPR